jgi:hypothetical protein
MRIGIGKVIQYAGNLKLLPHVICLVLPESRIDRIVVAYKDRLHVSLYHTLMKTI